MVFQETAFLKYFLGLLVGDAEITFHCLETALLYNSTHWHSTERRYRLNVTVGLLWSEMSFIKLLHHKTADSKYSVNLSLMKKKKLLPFLYFSGWLNALNWELNIKILCFTHWNQIELLSYCFQNPHHWTVLLKQENHICI